MSSPNWKTHHLSITPTEQVMFDWQAPTTQNGVVVYVHGLSSHRHGEKAEYFAQRFIAQGWGVLKMDLRGHGESDGSMKDLTLSRCLADLDSIINWLPCAPKPLLLIGSSMGAAVATWWSFMNHTEQHLLGLLAPALSFPMQLRWNLGPKALHEWQQTGTRTFAEAWDPVQIGFSLMEDGLNYDPLQLAKGLKTPALIVHGMQDDVVDWKNSVNFIEETSAPVDLLLLKNGDHRLTAHQTLIFDSIWNWHFQHMSHAT